MHINSGNSIQTSHRLTGRGIIKDTESKRALVSSAKNNKFLNNYYHESGLPKGTPTNLPLSKGFSRNNVGDGNH